MRCDREPFRWHTTIITLIVDEITSVDHQSMQDVPGGASCSPRIFTELHPRRLDLFGGRRLLQPTVRLSNPERTATGSSGALKTDVVSRTAAARTK